MNILITGTSQGIGLAIAKKFLIEGHKVYGVDIKKSALPYTDYTHFELDIRDKKALINLAINLPLMDIVVNNAGTQNEDDIQTNLMGTMNVTEAFGIQKNIKAILMIGSASAHTGAEFAEYSASKGGVLAYTKYVALHIAEFGATCNSLDLGGVLTDLNAPVINDKALWEQIMDLTPLKRWMTAEEAADWAYFLTVINHACTGQNILVDNGEAGNCKFIWK